MGTIDNWNMTMLLGLQVWRVGFRLLPQNPSISWPNMWQLGTTGLQRSCYHW